MALSIVDDACYIENLESNGYPFTYSLTIVPGLSICVSRDNGVLPNLIIFDCSIDW